MTVSITCRARGPLVVEFGANELEIRGLDGHPRELNGAGRLLLCRCGASRARPYCDGAHNRTRFEAPTEE